MKIRMIYEGRDITDYINITKCLCHDQSRGRCDTAELELDHAAAWYEWQPQRDDRISLSYGGYETGTLYLNTIRPEENKYRIIATSLPSTSRLLSYATFEKKNLSAIVAACAAECGMGFELHGISGGLDYDYLLRENEGCAAFLERIAGMEGAALKCVNGALKLIGILYAQTLSETCSLRVDTQQSHAVYISTRHDKLGGIRVVSPFGEAKATDSAYSGGSVITLCHLPVRSAAQAGRWARGLLLTHNRTAEVLNIESMAFKPCLTALCRVRVEGNTDASGYWLVDEVIQDLYNEHTSVVMLKAITTIR